jgi:signal transduction histidine kinase
MDLHDWVSYAQRHSIPRGEYLFHEGDPSDALYIIDKGQVAIIKGALTEEPLVLNYRGEDELIGEVSLVTDVPRTASVMAVENTIAHRITRDDFWSLFQDDNAFRQIVMRTLVDRLLAADASRMRDAAAERDLFDRLSSLASENEQLAELMQLRQETIRFIVHDLRNPLNLMLMALHAIERTTDVIDDETTSHYITMARGGAARMLSLVESLLDVERLESGQATLDVGEVDVKSMIDEVAAQQRPVAHTADSDVLVRHRDGDLPPLHGDKVRLSRVITNLVDNGLKFTVAGEPVVIETWRDDDKLVVAVEDGGPGIPPEQRRRVFDRFVQTDSGKAQKRGFGLGLAYCRSAVNAHGGDIWVEEAESRQGSRFVFTIPFEGAGEQVIPPLQRIP